MKLIQTFFKDKNQDRHKEYLFCIQKNIQATFIDEIHFLIDEKESLNEEILKHPKITVKQIDSRLEYGMALQYAKDNFSPDEIVALANLDIFFEDSNSWRQLENELFVNDNVPRAMALSRTEYFGVNSSIRNFKQSCTEGFFADSFSVGCFADSWIFPVRHLDKFLKTEDLNFCIGLAPHCDGLMFGLMKKYFIVFNWAEKYVTLHLDLCRKIRNMSPIYTDKTDWRTENRKNETSMISPIQNWEKILKESYKGSNRMIKGAFEDRFLREELHRLLEAFNIDTIIETGTYKGWSTDLLAQTGKKVITIEINSEYHEIAKDFNYDHENIEFYLGSSEDILEKLIPVNGDNNILFFLDAHWEEYWPILDELSLIQRKGIKPVIIIHDFYVPDEKGRAKFGFDQYKGQNLDFPYVKPSMDLLYGYEKYVHYCIEESEIGAGVGVFVPKTLER